MAWARFTNAYVNSRKPEAFAVCDRCGFVYNRTRLHWQYDWSGLKIRKLGILVCQTCLDVPQEQLRTIILPPDPIPIPNPRPGEFGSMAISSSPERFDTIVPSQLAVEDDVTFDQINGIYPDLSPLVTEGSSVPLEPEWQDTLIPDNPGATYYSTSVAPSSI